MTRRRIGRITEVKRNFTDYNYLLNGIGGIGKTTMLAEIGMKLCGTDGLLLLSIGREPLPDHLGGVWNERAKDWDDLEEIIETIIEYKNEDYPNLKMVGIDSTDELFRLAEAKVVALHNESVDNPSKMVKTVGAAFGGFQKGENKVIDIVTELIFKLNDIGIKLFFIGHTKKKAQKDLATDIEYELLTSNIDSKYYNAIKDKVNLVGTAYVEREMSDVQTVKDAFSKGNKKVGRIASEQRVIAFRDEEHAIDDKSHFEFIASKCEFDTDIFIHTVMDAIEKQANKFNQIPNLKTSSVDTEKVETTNNTSMEDLLKGNKESASIIDENKNKELKSKIQKAMAGITDKSKAGEVKTILAKYESKTLDTKKPVAMFEEILKIFE